MRRVRAPRLSVYRWRAPMLASALHRIMGFLLAWALVGFLAFLQMALGAPERFETLVAFLRAPWGTAVFWLAAVAALYHWLNGLRFLLLDLGVGEAPGQMRFSARLVLALAAAGALLIGGLL
ncbi:MAG: succinate dehydrogenase, cytochrome b556 subunit [Zetaproteobacteria bacterium]|nr:MAG: succinate dehydrogenase, cytochrome b556 subunit [Zetaproteobacteria bacterium]